MTIGDRIRQRRMELEMSQDELATRIGFSSRSSINKIEIGKQNLPQSKIKAVADALDTTPGYIMGWTEKEPGTQKVDAELEKLYDVISQLTPDNRSKLLELSLLYLDDQRRRGQNA